MTNSSLDKIVSLLKLKMKFAASSSLATAVDYGLYLFLVSSYFSPVTSNVISAGSGMLINFVIQKSYVFELNRKLRITFVISLLSSLVGLAMGTGLIYYLNKFSFFSEHQVITKGIAIGLIFFYNFYMKRFAFENKFL